MMKNVKRQERQRRITCEVYKHILIANFAFLHQTETEEYILEKSPQRGLFS